MKRLKTLRVRFALWTAGLLLAALTLFSGFVYIRMAQSLAASVDSALKLAASQVVAEADVEQGQLAPIDELLEDLPNIPLVEQGFSFRLLASDGQTIQEYGPYQNLPPPQGSFSAPGQPGNFSTFTDNASRHQVRVYNAPVVKNNQVAGTVQVVQNLNRIEQTLSQLLITLLVGVPLLAVMAGAGGYFLAGRALAPIGKITRTAQKISAEDLSARLNLPNTADEAGQLAATFDSMLARLDDAFKRERQFTADASHELRTPLAAMQTIIGSTLARRRSPAEYEQALIDLNQETEQMKTLTEGLLHLARSDAAPRRIEAFEPVDLSLLLKDVVDSLAPLAEDKGLKLIDNVPDNGLTVCGDNDGLIRLFVNVVANAVKYTNQGSISVTAKAKENDLLEVIISDTGVGITPEHLPHIFNRFYRVDQARSADGSGLGLAIAKSVALAHGGRIVAESTIGLGTTITVELSTQKNHNHE